MTPPVTNHARRRWAERFPGRDLDAELNHAKRPSKKRINDLLKQVPQRYGAMVAAGGGFLISAETNPPAVFVLAADQVRGQGHIVVTAYPLLKRAPRYY